MVSFPSLDMLMLDTNGKDVANDDPTIYDDDDNNDDAVLIMTINAPM